MSDWIHLSLNFKNYDEAMVQFRNNASPQNKPIGLYKELISYLKEIVDSLSPDLIDRYFYLFEPNPHLFLALEVKEMKNIDLIKDKINQIKVPDFIDSKKVELSSCDENNGEAALDFFNRGTKYAFFRISDNYKPGYDNNDEVKLIHCFSNQLFCDRDNEIMFYIKCLQHRGVEVKK